MFSVVNMLALHSRPGRIDTLVSVFSRDRERPNSFRDFSYPLYRDLRERRDIFDNLLAHTFSLVGFDPATIALAAVSLAAATLLAPYLPARRATRIAPLEALRTE